MDDEKDTAYLTFLKARRQELLERIAEAAAKAGRDASEVGMLAVSKTVGPEEVALAWEAGYRAFGENRPQELKRKVEALEGRPGVSFARFDMIGHLQTNKVRLVVGTARLIHSINSEHLAEAVSKRSESEGLVSDVLIEVNVSGEQSKSGCPLAEAPALAEYLLGLGGVRLCGLMTMAPAQDPDAARASFSGLRELRDQLAGRTGLELPVLSCGMSDDFQIAVEEGSTLVRLGRTVFDKDYRPN